MRSLAKLSRPVQGFRPRVLIVATLSALAVLAGGSTAARAGYDVSGNSSGVAISSNLSLLGLVNANVAVNQVAGTAPNPYSTTLSPSVGANISAGVVGLNTLLQGTTGLLTSTAASSIDGVSTSGSASGSTVINNLNLNVLASSLPLVNALVTVKATTLTTNSSVTGTYGALSPTGAFTFSGLEIDVLGVNVTALIEASAGASVDIASVAGLSIGLNVVSSTGDGISTSSVTTDNLIVSFNNASALGVALNGSLIIGQSQAFIQAAPGTAVPEPSSLAMMGLGLLLTGGFGYRARRRQRPLMMVA